jgi:hypothetical protein
VQQLRGDDVILAGNYIELGLNNSGSVMSTATTATGGQVGIAQSVSFDANSGFIDFGFP